MNEPMIGDSLYKSDTDQTFWMGALMPKGEKLDVKNLKQQACGAALKLPALRPLDGSGGDDAHLVRADLERERQDAVRGYPGVPEAGLL